MAPPPRYEEPPTSIDPGHIKKLQRVKERLKHQPFPIYTDAGVYEDDMIAPPQTELFLLWAQPEILDWRSVGFGGTTSPTADGVKVAEFLAQIAAAKSCVVISGGVPGIDQAAHTGALDKHGQTIAVLANPVQYGLHPYIPHRQFLEEGMRANGSGLLSEYQHWADFPVGSRLQERDRIISALSDIFVAVECSQSSDTVDTARRCKLQGNQPIAINWHKIKLAWHHQPNSTGGDYLIQKGWAKPFPPADVSEPISILEPRFTELFEQLIEQGSRRHA